MLAVGPIKQEVVAVAAGLSEHFAGLALKVAVDQDRRLNGIPVVGVVGRDLKVPGDLAGVDVQRNDGAGPEIVAFAALAGHYWIGIAGAEVIKMQVGIVGAGHPGHAAAVAHGVLHQARSPSRDRPSSGARVHHFHCTAPVSGSRDFEESGDIERVAAGADNDMVANDDGRGRREVFLLHVGDLDVPAFFAGFGIERDEVVVGGFEEQPVAVHADAAVADVDAALRVCQK